MSHSPNINGQSFRIDHSHVRARVGATIAVFAIAFVLVIYAQYASSRQADLIRMLGLFLGCFALIPLVHSVTETWFQSRVFRNISLFFHSDRAFCVITNDIGIVVGANQSAQAALPGSMGDSLTIWLSAKLPDAAMVISKMRRILLAQSYAEDIVLTEDGHWRIAAWQQGRSRILWRLERLSFQDGEANFPSPIASIRVAANGTIRDLNQAARDVLGSHATQLCHLSDSKKLTWNAINTIETRAGRQDFFVLNREVEGGCEIFLLPPDVASSAPPESSDFAVLPVPMVKLSVDGTIVQANSYACQLLDISSNQKVMIQDLLEGLGRSIPDWIEDAVQGRAINHPEFLRLARRDKEVFVQVILNRIKLGDEDGLIAVLSDATELKSLEAQFVHSQKMQAIGQLAGGVAHDFNNLLTAITGHCDLLLLRHDDQSQDFADLTQINQNANRAAALVSQLLAFSRKQTLRPESLNMRDTLADLTHLLNRLVGEKVDLDLTHDPRLRHVRADKRQLEQVLMNLVVNARDAMPDGGKIEIQTQNWNIDAAMSRDRVTIPIGEYVKISVRDQGCGIPADKLSKIFEPFYTTKRIGEGTGLGLSTAYGIVKQTGGYIFVDSILGQGTEFTLIFPAIDADPITQAPIVDVTPKAKVNHGCGVILLVEDEAPVRTFASRALKLRGHQVIEACSAEEALEKLRDQSLRVDVFVTDIVMPGRDGPSWVKEALVERPNTRVVFVSGYAEDVLETQQASVPNSVFLPKPFSLDALTQTVQQQMH